MNVTLFRFACLRDKDTLFQHVLGFAIGALAVCNGWTCTSARAGLIDLTAPPTTVQVANAIYETSDARSTGTGVINPFVRVQANGTEQGYNTSTRPVPFDENTTANYMHDVQLQDLAVNNINGTDYVTFLLDSNQSGNQVATLLSLDQVKMYVSPTNGHNSTNLSTLGTLIYDLDATTDNWVLLDSQLNSGSGQGDMLLHVPLSLFTPFSAQSYFTLYSQFGTHNASNAGPEEWKTVGGSVSLTLFSVPEPSSLALLSVGGLIMACRRRHTQVAQ